MNNEPATHEPIMRYSVEAAVVQRGLGRAVSREASIEFDTSVEQSASLMGPADLLASAFAACVLKNVERFARMLSFTYDDRLHPGDAGAPGQAASHHERSVCIASCDGGAAASR